MDWSQFEMKINIKCSQTEAWLCWMNSDKIKWWFLEDAIFYHPDDVALKSNEIIYPACRYEWKWYTYEGYVGQGKILKVVENELVSFTFDESVVEVTFEKNETVEGEIILTLKQHSMPTDDASKAKLHVGCKTGWTYHLTNLKNLLEGGHDLRNRQTPGMFNA